MAGYGLYNERVNVPYDGTPVAVQPFELTQKTWATDVFHGMYFDMMFSDLFGPTGSMGGIIYDASQPDKGSRVRIPMRRPVAKGNTPNAIGDLHVIDYGTPASSLANDMVWAYMDIYSRRVRFAWQSLGKESRRLLEDYGQMTEATRFLGESHKQFLESEIVTALKLGNSSNLTNTTISGYLAGDGGAYNAAIVANKTFDRDNIVSTYDIEGLVHPNELFPSTVALLTSAGADQSEAQMIAAVQSNQLGLTVDVLEQLIPSLRARKIQPIRTPWGLKWVMLVHPYVAAALRQDADFREQQLNAAPRSYTENVLWQAEVGVVGGFVILESQYIDADATSTSTYPCYIVGQNCLGMSQPESMSLSMNNNLDGDNWVFLIAATTYGLCRTDWMKDTGAAAGTANIVVQDGATYNDGHANVKAWNSSSALLWVYAPAGTAA